VREKRPFVERRLCSPGPELSRRVEKVVGYLPLFRRPTSANGRPTEALLEVDTSRISQ
jgi:hypothetical protein